MVITPQKILKLTQLLKIRSYDTQVLSAMLFREGVVPILILFISEFSQDIVAGKNHCCSTKGVWIWPGRGGKWKQLATSFFILKSTKKSDKISLKNSN